MVSDDFITVCSACTVMVRVDSLTLPLAYICYQASLNPPMKVHSVSARVSTVLSSAHSLIVSRSMA